ncbi:MAG TPA: hypothetical protein VG986_18930, partial [Pseudolabrys sp.]|nr:hypothetical protein [Pseudolabrys sp.]
NYSGALYAFAFGKIGGICSATDEIRAGRFDFLDLVREKLFLSEEIGWYKSPNTEIGVEDFYSNSEEYSPTKDGKRLDRLRESVFDIFGGGASIDEDHYQIGSFRCEHVRRHLRKFFDSKVPLVVSHGDFNTNNIILSRASNALSTIDFEYTGPDCFYKDFISLESSIRTAWMGGAMSTPDECWKVFEVESALLNGKPLADVIKGAVALEPLFAAICKIRQAARESIEKSKCKFEPDLYALALGFHMLKLCGLAVWDRSAKVRLIACLMACCDKLQKL